MIRFQLFSAQEAELWGKASNLSIGNKHSCLNELQNQQSIFVCPVSTVARRDSGVLSQRQSGAGGLQAGHENGRKHPEGTLQTASYSCYPRAGEKHKCSRGNQSRASKRRTTDLPQCMWETTIFPLSDQQ